MNIGVFKYHEMCMKSILRMLFCKNIGKSYRETAEILGYSKVQVLLSAKSYEL